MGIQQKLFEQPEPEYTAPKVKAEEHAWLPQPINYKKYPYRYGIRGPGFEEFGGGLTRDTAKRLYDNAPDATELVEGVFSVLHEAGTGEVKIIESRKGA